MNETTVAELIELLQNESASIDTQFQLWITISSAVIIATFVVRHRFSLLMKIFVSVMYSLASATIALRYANDATQFEFLKNELAARGVEYPTFFDLRILRGLVYLAGTFATIGFVFLNSRLTVDRDSAEGLD